MKRKRPRNSSLGPRKRPKKSEKLRMDTKRAELSCLSNKIKSGIIIQEISSESATISTVVCMSIPNIKEEVVDNNDAENGFDADDSISIYNSSFDANSSSMQIVDETDHSVLAVNENDSFFDDSRGTVEIVDDSLDGNDENDATTSQESEMQMPRTLEEEFFGGCSQSLDGTWNSSLMNMQCADDEQMDTEMPDMHQVKREEVDGTCETAESDEAQPTGQEEETRNDEAIGREVKMEVEEAPSPSLVLQLSPTPARSESNSPELGVDCRFFIRKC